MRCDLNKRKNAVNYFEAIYWDSCFTLYIESVEIKMRNMRASWILRLFTAHVEISGHIPSSLLRYCTVCHKWSVFRISSVTVRLSLARLGFKVGAPLCFNTVHFPSPPAPSLRCLISYNPDLCIEDSISSTLSLRAQLKNPLAIQREVSPFAAKALVLNINFPWFLPRFFTALHIIEWYVEAKV
jgi:hypothetical protein